MIVKVTSWNLLHGQTIPPGLTANSEVAEKFTQEQLLTAIAQRLTSDVVGLQEVDEAQPRSEGHSQVQSIAKQMGAAYWGYAKTVIGTPGEEWRKLEPEERIIETQSSHNDEQSPVPSYGIGLISRIPVVAWHRMELGRSKVGLPLAFPSERGVKLIYVRDEPRTALAAQLANGYTVAVTHLSFVPFVNIYQLWKVQRWLRRLPGKSILMGDLNLPFNIPIKVSRWKSKVACNTYPSWGPKIQFDYILTYENLATAIAKLAPSEISISDHLPITVEFVESRFGKESPSIDLH